jgi:Protein of unknown function (DUF559)
MPLQPHRPKDLQWQVFRGSEAIGRRLVTADQLRSRAWFRVRQDVYADARLDRDHELVCRAAALRLPPRAILAGPSAAYLLGVEHAASERDPVHVITPPDSDLGPRGGLRAHATRLLASEITEHGGLRLTTPARTAWDVACWLDIVTAVGIVDGLLGQGLVTAPQLDGLVAARRGERGWRRAAEAFGLADGNAQSPPESQLRVRLVVAGLPRPIAQFAVPLPTGITVHPDLAWPEFKVAVEYDGHWHADADQLHRDRRRLNQLVAAGWIVLHVTSQRLHRDFARVLREIRDALTSRGWRP